jgi:hypothetical protein
MSIFFLVISFIAFLVFLFTIISAIIYLIRKSPKAMKTGWPCLISFGISFLFLGLFSSTYQPETTESNGEVHKSSKVNKKNPSETFVYGFEQDNQRNYNDKNRLEFKIKSYKYNKTDDSVDVDLLINVPNGTKVNFDLVNNTSSEDVYVVGQLKSIQVNNGKQNLHFTRDNLWTENNIIPYDDSDTYFSGKYELSAEVDASEQMNYDFYKAMGSLKTINPIFEESVSKDFAYSDNAEYGACFPSKKININGSMTVSQYKTTERYSKYKKALAEVEKKNKEQEAKENKKKKEQEKIKKQKAKLVKQQKIVNKKANAKLIRYAELEKNPDKYSGEYVKYRGQIVQIMEDDGYTVIRLSVTQDSFGWSSDDIVFITYESETKYVRDDVVTVYGNLNGSKTYESEAGYEITIPSMEAEYID